MKEDFGVAAGEAVLNELIAVKPLLNDYSQWSEKMHGGKFNELATEVGKRIQQLQSLLSKIIVLLKEAADIQSGLGFPQLGSPDEAENANLAWQERMKEQVSRDLMKRSIEIMSDLELFTEASYWFAARARTAIRALPRLEGFEAKGIRDVRNKLLEHPEKDGGVLITSFAYGAPRGPVVKAMRENRQVGIWEDKGLFVNLDEFAKNLQSLVRKCKGGG